MRQITLRIKRVNDTVNDSQIRFLKTLDQPQEEIEISICKPTNRCTLSRARPCCCRYFGTSNYDE